MATDVGSAVGYLDLDISGFLAGLRSAQSEADTESKNIATKIGNNLQGVGKGMTSAGSTLTKTVTTPVLGLGTAAVKVTSDFESAMSNVSAISGATGGDLDALNKKAQEMGAKTKFSATESADAFTYMAMAGWKTEDMMNGIDGIMSLAAADGLDLATTSDIVTDALTAFGLSASDSGHFADVLAKASSSANTNVSMLGESFKYAAPVAGALGYSAEDTAIALGLMANAGIKGSQGGTALRGSLTRLIKPADDAAALMEQYGLSMTNADGSMKSLGEVMNMLRDKLGGLSEAEQAQAAATLFGQESMSGMLAIINASDSDYENLTDSIYNADGAAQQMADTKLDNFSGQLTLLKSALEGLAIQLGEILMPYVKQFVTWLQNLTQKFQELTPEQKEQIVKWAAIVAAIGPVLMVLGKLTSSVGSIITTFGKIPGAIKAVTGGFTKLTTAGKNVFEGFKLAKAGFTALGAQASPLGTALAGITAPMIAIVAVIAVLVAAFVTLWKTNEDFRNKITEMWDGIKAKFMEAGQKITDAVNSLGFNFTGIVDVLKAAWEGFCNLLAPVFLGIVEEIKSIISGIVDIFTGIIQVICGVIKGFKDGDWTLLLEGFKSIFDGIISVLLAPLKGIWRQFTEMLESFGTSWDECWNSVKQFFVDTWNAISSFFVNMANSIKTGVSNFITTIINFFVQLPTNIANFITNAYNAVVTWVSNMVSKAREMGTNFLNAVVEFFTNLPYKVGYFIGNTLANVVIWVANMVAKAKEMGTNFLNKVVAFFTQLPGKVLQFVTSALNNVRTWATNMVNKAKEMATNFLNNVVRFFTQLPGKVLQFITNAFNNVKTWTTNMVTKAREMGTNFINNVVSFFTQLPGKVLQFITSAFNNIKTWATNVANKAQEMGKNFINNVVSFFTQLPGKVLQFITNAFNNVKTWAANMVNKAREMGTNFISNVVSFIQQLPGKIKQYLDNAINNLKTWVTQMGQKGKEAIQSLIDNVMSAASNIVDKVKSIGSNIVSGVWNGIEGAANTFMENVKGFFSGIVDGVKDTLGIHSPSKVMEDEVGTNIALGVIKGIKKKEGTAKKTASEMAQIIVDAASKQWERYNLTHKTTLADEVAFWKKIKNECKKGTDAYYDALKKYKDADKSLKDSIKSVKDEYKQSWTEIKENLKNDIQEVADSYNDTFVSRVNEIKGQLGDLFSAYTFEETEDTAETLKSNLQSQVNALNDWDAQMRALSLRQGISDDFLQEVRDMGVDATQQVKILNSMTDEELNDYLSLWKQKNKKANNIAKEELTQYKKECEEQVKVLTQAANKELTALEDKYTKSLKSLGVKTKDTSKDIGMNIVKGLKKGIESENKDFNKYLKSFFKGITSTAKDALGIHSPSKVFAEEVGKWLPAGMAEGFVSAMPGATGEINDAINDGIKDIDSDDVKIGGIETFAKTLKMLYNDIALFFEDIERRLNKSIVSMSDNLVTLVDAGKAIAVHDSTLGYVSYGGFVSVKDAKRSETDNVGNVQKAGDTYNFYSQARLSEIECRNEMIRAKKELALDF